MEDNCLVVTGRQASGLLLPDRRSPAPARAREPVPLPTPRCPRYRALDLWRGVACLLVVVFHSTFYAAGRAEGGSGVAAWVVAATARLWIGVPMFFVISGYCISATVDATRRRPCALSTYFVRRLRRIYPPFWILLGLSVGLITVLDGLILPGLFADANHPVPPLGSLTLGQWLGNLTLTESWRHHAVGGRLAYFLGHAWTLCYEEQFYAVAGLLLLAAPRRFFKAAALLTVLVGMVRLGSNWLGVSTEGFFCDGRWILFAAGILVYHRVNYAAGARAWLQSGLLLLGIAYAARTPSRLLGPHTNFETELFVACTFALAIALLHPWDSPLASARLLRPVTFCGTICYSLYLVHWPVVKGLSHGLSLAGLGGNWATLLVTIPACAAASVSLAWVFHRTVERRFLNAPQPGG